MANLATHLLLMAVTLNWLVNSYRINGSPMSNASLRAAAAKWLDDPGGASALYGAINTWDTSSVTDMGELFLDAKDFNENIGAWDVSRVVQMDGLFEGAMAFNQNLASWEVSKVVAMNRMFARASSFNQNLEAWDVSKVKDLTAMFSGATAFDQVLAKWDTSKVQDMRYMFHGATRFNQPLESWDMSRCTDMSYMFWGAAAFNRPIEKLRVSSVQSMIGVVTPHPRTNKTRQLQTTPRTRAHAHAFSRIALTLMRAYVPRARQHDVSLVKDAREHLSARPSSLGPSRSEMRPARTSFGDAVSLSFLLSAV